MPRFILIRCFCLTLLLQTDFKSLRAQELTEKKIWDSLISVENAIPLSADEKLKHVLFLKEQFESHKYLLDSVYARILHRVSLYKYSVNDNIANADIIHTTLQAIQINTSGKKNASPQFAVSSYRNAGYYYKSLRLYDAAIKYFDSSIQLGEKISAGKDIVTRAIIEKAYLLFLQGDYEKSAEENTRGLSDAKNLNDSALILDFFSQRAQAFLYQNELKQALTDADSANFYAQRLNASYEIATAIKLKALINTASHNTANVEQLFIQAIKERKKANNFSQVADDYTDFGNYYLNEKKQYTKAIQCYQNTITNASKTNDFERMAKAYVNIGQAFFRKQDFVSARQYYSKCFQSLNIATQNDFLANPSSKSLSAISSKDLLLVLLNNKTELLLNLFKSSRNVNYLDATLKTALLTDTVITQLRHEQLSEQSKLYWRNKTREFFENIIEACYYYNSAENALFFMEKSRAVLLNDKLNELNASLYLSKEDAKAQENYELKILELQQKLSSLEYTSKQYQQVQYQLVNTRTDFEHFIASLEQKYPAYYQYKYEDSVPSLTQLQSYLAKNHQSFVHYFIGDTTTYILGITSTSTKFIRLSQNEFNKEQLTEFLQFCANKEMLNRRYQSFSDLSNSIYKKIFQQLQLPQGRIIICQDNIVIPFEALCSDTKGKNFLLSDYSFDYVYSARFLMKQFKTPAAKGNFAGFAPVSFNDNLKVVALINAASALKTSSSYYSKNKLFTHESATRSNFFNYAASYSIVNIFSHAKADTIGEPVLYMQDSIVHLSDLQRLNNPATKFVLLSACQTNVGKTATGEGVYSLARGFAAAGIPSISATLWNADEATIYEISSSFNKNLAEGMTKDEALQKAKTAFLKQNTGSQKLLPYYWANMILIGNPEAITLDSSHGKSIYLIIIIGAAALIIASILYARKKYR